MNAISHLPTMHRDTRADEHSDARTEMARHYSELRLHALLMLAGSLVAAYFGFLIVGVEHAAVLGASAGEGMSPDILSGCALVIFASIAVFCLVEAHRCWRRAANTGAPKRPDAVEVEPPQSTATVVAFQRNMPDAFEVETPQFITTDATYQSPLTRLIRANGR